MHKALGRNRKCAIVRQGGTGLSLQGGAPVAHGSSAGLLLLVCCETSAPSPRPTHRAAFFLQGWESLCPFRAADLTSCSGARACSCRLALGQWAFRFFSLRCLSSQRQLSTLGIPHSGFPAGTALGLPRAGPPDPTLGLCQAQVWGTRETVSGWVSVLGWAGTLPAPSPASGDRVRLSLAPEPGPPSCVRPAL